MKIRIAIINIMILVGFIGHATCMDREGLKHRRHKSEVVAHKPTSIQQLLEEQSTVAGQQILRELFLKTQLPLYRFSAHTIDLLSPLNALNPSDDLLAPTASHIAATIKLLPDESATAFIKVIDLMNRFPGTIERINEYDVTAGDLALLHTTYALIARLDAISLGETIFITDLIAAHERFPNQLFFILQDDPE